VDKTTPYSLTIIDLSNDWREKRCGTQFAVCGLFGGPPLVLQDVCAWRRRRQGMAVPEA
jgi:hypothetical protein